MKQLKHFSLIILLPVSLWAATITGIVGAPAPGTPVSGVKVVLIENTSAGAHLDSTTTAANGTYTFNNVTVGQRVVQASKYGYNSALAVQAVSNATAAYTVNVSISVSKTSVIQGFVNKAVDFTSGGVSDTSMAIGATVVLSGGSAGDNARTAVTDSVGHYRFDSVSAGTGYTVSAALVNYNGDHIGNVAVAWNSTANVATIHLIRIEGRLSGTIRRNDTNTYVIPNAKIVASIGGVKVDSATTDVNGNYVLLINASTYTISVSAAGFKSNHGFKTKDTTATIGFGLSTVLNTGLTPALSTIGGTFRTSNIAGPVVAGAKVVLQHRMSNTGAGNVWESVDSTITDAFGIFAFQNLIAAPTVAAGSYRIVVTAAGHRSYPSTTAEVAADVYQVGYAATFTIFSGVLVGTIQWVDGDMKNNLRFSRLGDQLILNLNPSKISRTLEVFNMNGMLQRSVVIPVGETRVNVPAALAPEKGYLYGVK